MTRSRKTRIKSGGGGRYPSFSEPIPIPEDDEEPSDETAAQDHVLKFLAAVARAGISIPAVLGTAVSNAFGSTNYGSGIIHYTINRNCPPRIWAENAAVQSIAKKQKTQKNKKKIKKIK